MEVIIIWNSDRKRVNNIIKTVIFVFILAAMLMGLNYFFQPDFGIESNYRGKKAFDKEPENSVEVLFIGSSTAHHSISAMELYRDHGISAWNLGSPLQPVSASYYLLEDAYKAQGESLKTVFFEVLLLDHNSDDSFRHLATDAINHLDIKYRANRDYANNIKEALDYTVPLIEYHNRWGEITEEDFVKYTVDYRPYLRGYYLDTDNLYYDENEYDVMTVPDYQADFSSDYAPFTAESMYYLKKIIDFCENKGLKLVFFKSPMAENWDEASHNAVQSIADQYQLEYYDFNFEPLFDEIEFNYATDMSDGEHMNYYGVNKLTTWVGKYLVNEGDVNDFRGIRGYEYLEEELVRYKEKVEKIVELKALKDPADYLEAVLSNNAYTVFISVKDDASSNLRDDQRIRFLQMGLPILSNIEFRDHYIAVVDSYGGIYENIEKNLEQEVQTDIVMTNLELMEGSTLNYVLGEQEKAEKVEDDIDDYSDSTITHDGNLMGGRYFKIISGEDHQEAISSVNIDGAEQALDKRGLNIVVYDNDLCEVVDSAVFDTCGYSTRVGNDLASELSLALAKDTDPAALPEELEKLYFYNQRCEDERTSAHYMSGSSEESDYNMQGDL